MALLQGAAFRPRRPAGVSRPRRYLPDNRANQLRWMQRPDTGEVGNLMPARGPASHQDRAIIEAPRGRQQPPLSDGARHLEVFARIAEGSGHAATAGIEI